MRQEEEALQWFTDDYNARPYLYEKDGFGGRGNERAISRLNEEIAELVSWLGTLEVGVPTMGWASFLGRYRLLRRQVVDELT